MTRTIIYKGKKYNGIFISIYNAHHDIYIDRQAHLAILIDIFDRVKSIQKLETYQIDVLLNGDEDIEYLDELEKLEDKFKNEMNNE